MDIIKSLFDRNDDPCVEVLSIDYDDGRLYVVDVLPLGLEFSFKAKAEALDVAQAYINRINRKLRG